METKRFSAEMAGSSRDDYWRRRCGCLRTSDKLKKMIEQFPTPPPPTPMNDESLTPMKHTCISAYCTQIHSPLYSHTEDSGLQKSRSMESDTPFKKESSKMVRLLKEVVQLLQFSVTTTAVAIYYLIYCYMQLIYYTLWSAIYFHNADGPMKVTIAVIAVTSIIMFFNLIYKLEKLIGTGLIN